MTRANINFLYWKHKKTGGATTKTLYFYQNGDQYPRGLRDFYHVEDFLDMEWTPENFKKWLGANYKVQGRQITKMSNGITLDAHCELEEPAKTSSIPHPCIYYDRWGGITDWSYVFDATLENTVKAYCWDKLEFSGTREEFRKWIKKQT